jgi:predicted acetyltransferase
MPASDEQWQGFAASYESDREFGAFDPELVGVARSSDAHLTVPGGDQLTAGVVVDVAVRANRTRRGIMTDLMGAQLTDMAGRGVAAAVLTASEASIYRRFGYGIATRARAYTVNRRTARLRAEVPGDGHIELLDFEVPARLIPDVYAQVAGARPGMITRTPYWWARAAAVAGGAMAGVAAAAGPVAMGPVMTAVYHGPDGPAGYAVYSVRRAPQAPAVLRVIDMHSGGPAAFGALWRYLLSVDLVDEIEAPTRSLDEPVELLFTDPRACQTTSVTDEQWLRLIDVPAALAARSYAAAAGAVVIEVIDPLLEGNRGTYRVSAEGAQPSVALAQLRLGVAALADIYLGTWRPSALAQAGLAEVRDPAALAVADRLFAAPAVPWCGTILL